NIFFVVSFNLLFLFTSLSYSTFLTDPSLNLDLTQSSIHTFKTFNTLLLSFTYSSPIKPNFFNILSFDLHSLSYFAASSVINEKTTPLKLAVVSTSLTLRFSIFPISFADCFIAFVYTSLAVYTKVSQTSLYFLPNSSKDL